MKLSYAVTICNEFEETINLITTLLNYKGENSEIVVLLDTPKASAELIEYLELQAEANHIDLIESEFNNDFANWKNFLNLQCKGEWIFQLDADEMLDPNLIVNLEDILDNNTDKDLILVPRINIVNGLTQSHIEKWGWQVNDRGWVNWPDVQTRLYKNKANVYWSGKVHERIVGYEAYTNFPGDEVYCIKHIKDIKRQETQNSYYDTL
ncbi:Glyco_tranf_GTA_type domain containing protein [uncultured Caudovirales phage]|uniref:Glyco_tranf_GTA_type domain containing protein n=1 Tax=uncultured Caudovirales phage TaxID=2100421 RepID=A0A6J5M9C8_9CAUD|nr:Glyco_tranf_GTA_type domain containing protein [uncultured Caudovirales phage]